MLRNERQTDHHLYERLVQEKAHRLPRQKDPEVVIQLHDDPFQEMIALGVARELHAEDELVADLESVDLAVD